MTGNLSVHCSNQMEILLTLLKDSLFQNSKPFTRRLLVVPSPIMRSWILLNMAKDSDLSIAMGVEMTYINQVISQLMKCFPTCEQAGGVLPSLMEMALAVEIELKKMISEEEWPQLTRFLNTSSHTKSARRLMQLSQELAKLFIQYGVYAGGMIEEWADCPKDWQSSLFLKVFKAHPHWTTPHDQLASLLSETPEIRDWQVHLFGLNFLSSLHHHFFKCVSKTIPVNYYLLSPCEQYWGDVASDNELSFLRKQWQKQGVTDKQQQELEDYFQDRHVLLANLGKLGRKMWMQIEDDCGEGHFIHQPSVRKTLLGQLQNDMLELRSGPEKAEVEETSSIQLHIAPSRHREVQILYNNLLHLIEKHQYHPSNIIVMAPDITPYVPFIKAVFDHDTHPLDFQIFDLKMSSQNSVIQSFQALIQLSKSRWDVVSLMQFMQLPAVMRKHGFTENNLLQIQEWITKTRIRWGSDVTHRSELLEVASAPSDRSGTWEYGLERLLLGLIADPDTSHLPYEAIEMTEAPLLGKLIDLIRSLKEDLKPLSESSEKPIHHWALYLKCLYEGYFTIDRQDDEMVREEEHLLHIFDRFLQTKEFDEKSVFSWTTIQGQLDLAFAEQAMNFRESHVDAVKFCSMLPMRAIPAQVVVLMGMEEGVFPKKDVPSPLNQMLHHSKADYVPSSKDFDRYLFLEALMSAREYFLLSYTQESSETKPSILIKELMSTLNHTLSYQNKTISEECTTTHPFSAFDLRYFQKQGKFYSYSQQDYAAALAKNETGKQSQHFMSQLFECEQSAASEVTSMSLTQLFQCAKNPLKTYFNQALGMTIPDEELLNAEDSFLMSGLDNYRLKTESLTGSLDSVVEKGEDKGWWPPGLFKDISLNQFQQDGKALKEFLQGLDITEEDIWTVELNEHCLAAEKIDDHHWQVPSIRVENIVLTGSLDYVTREGLCCFNKESASDLFSLWPKILLLNVLSGLLDIKPQILLLKEHKTLCCALEQPEMWLKQYVEYVQECSKTASPLLPEWILDILKEEKLEETMNKELQNQFKQSYNRYLLWGLRDQQVGSVNPEVVQKWKTKFTQTVPLDHKLFSQLKIKL